MQPKWRSSSHKGTAQVCKGAVQATRAQPIQVCEGAAQATRVQPQTSRAQPKPQGHSPSLRGRSPSHKGSARLSLQGGSPSHSFLCIAEIRLSVIIIDLLFPFRHSARPNVVRTRVHWPPSPSPGRSPSPTHRRCRSHRRCLCPPSRNNIEFLPLPMCSLLSPHNGHDLLLGGSSR